MRYEQCLLSTTTQRTLKMLVVQDGGQQGFMHQQHQRSKSMDALADGTLTINVLQLVCGIKGGLMLSANGLNGPKQQRRTSKEHHYDPH